jgi:hypothetical protein
MNVHATTAGPRSPGAYSCLRRAGALLVFGLAAAVCGCGCGGSDTPMTNTMPAAPPPPPATGIVTFSINAATAATAPSQNPTFGGMAFGPVGPYQKIRGTASGKLDPKAAQNQVITDIALAPTDANGLVDYNLDFYILAPVDQSKGNHKVFFELVNRGGKQFGTFNGSSGGNDPTTAANAGTAFLMNQGYTLVWAGWESTVSRANASMGITTPVAVNADGSTITGSVYEYIEFDNATTTSDTTTYPTSTTDTTKATLTVKAHLTDAPTTIPATGCPFCATPPPTSPVAPLIRSRAMYRAWCPGHCRSRREPSMTLSGSASTRT